MWLKGSFPLSWLGINACDSLSCSALTCVVVTYQRVSLCLDCQRVFEPGAARWIGCMRVVLGVHLQDLFMSMSGGIRQHGWHLHS